MTTNFTVHTTRCVRAWRVDYARAAAEALYDRMGYLAV